MPRHSCRGVVERSVCILLYGAWLMSSSSTRFALISVSNKDGVVALARAVCDAGFTILSTGGTARVIADAGLPVTLVADVTGFPEIMGGRVKTLHPMIHGGLLANRELSSHLDVMAEHGIPDISLVVVNLYPFEQTIAADGVTLTEAVEQIDIGGPAMIRAAAKNFASVAVVVDPSAYDAVTDELARYGEVRATRRAELALEAFAHTASYDAAIVEYLAAQASANAKAQGEPSLPASTHGPLTRTMTLRYGENPHQQAALYHEHGARALGGIEQLHGKALSYNNIVDLDAALELVREFDEPACAIIKHTNPAGCARADTLRHAYSRALACDSLSAFGGIVSLNRVVDAELAQLLHAHFFEIIAAPQFDADALEILTAKKNLRLMRLPDVLTSPAVSTRQTLLGTLCQQIDPRVDVDFERWSVPTERAPTAQERRDLAFAWCVCKHVKSNAIVLARDGATLGVGAGQMSRVDSVRIAVEKAASDAAGAVLASDAFFPFRDGPDVAAAAGITALIQPGGSRRDQEVIDACNEHGVAMVFTGTRHFRH